MSGVQEILIVILIVLGILFIPRMSGRVVPNQQASIPNRIRLSGSMRLALVLSILWLLGAVIYHRPWENIAMSFYVYGLAPVIIAWSLYWILDGFKKRSIKKR